jgi:hypothetical protein
MAKLERSLDLDQENYKQSQSEILEAKVKSLAERHNSAIVWLTVITAGLLIYELLEIIPFENSILESFDGTLQGVEKGYLIALLTLVFWGLTMIVTSTIYYFRYRMPLKDASKKLADFTEKQRLSKEREPRERRDALLDQVRQMTVTIASVFIDNAERFKHANLWREQAGDILEAWQPDPATCPANRNRADLGDAETLLGQINELILREKSELQQQRRWRVLAIVIMLIYIALPITIIWLVPESTKQQLMIPVFGIPLSVIMWGAMGSLCAILYRFYMERGRVRLDLELRWLIARPIIGVIMGGLAYLAIVSGMALLNIGGAPGQNAQSGIASPQSLYVYWVIAFLAGFSDKFYVRFINLLAGKALGETGSEESLKSQTEAEKLKAISDTIKKQMFPNVRKRRKNTKPRRSTK